MRVSITEAAVPLAEWKSKAHTMLNAVTDGDFLCHGDFHPDNVMMTSGDPVLIDWRGSKKGIPAADFARTLVVLMTATLPAHIPMHKRLMMNAGRALFTYTYRRRYHRITQVHEDYVRAWMPPVCAARFNENPGDDLPALHRLMAKLVNED